MYFLDADRLTNLLNTCINIEKSRDGKPSVERRTRIDTYAKVLRVINDIKFEVGYDDELHLS